MEDLDIGYWELGFGRKDSLNTVLVGLEGAKYVHGNFEGHCDVIIFFNHNLIHSDIASSKLRGFKIKSAGFVRTFGELDEFTVYGESMSLDVKCDTSINDAIKEWLVANHQ